MEKLKIWNKYGIIFKILINLYLKYFDNGNNYKIDRITMISISIYHINYKIKILINYLHVSLCLWNIKINFYYFRNNYNKRDMTNNYFHIERKINIKLLFIFFIFLIMIKSLSSECFGGKNC